MRWLLWKEYRANRVIAFALFGLLIVPHLVALCVTWFDRPPWEWRLGLLDAGAFSLFALQLVPALIGANIIAGERADRSVEFQVYLPLSRRKILAGKLLLVLILAAAIWLINPPLMYWLARNDLASGRLSLKEALTVGGNLAVTGLTFFCVAWFFSSFLSSPVFSFAAGLLAPALVAGGMWITFQAYHYGYGMFPGNEMTFQTWYRILCIALSALCFAAGTWLYFRRVEP
jgi:ABC-type transport system involved in multi-copper enzyme maturation permease subunit